jgi:two-component system alkaline phosphatase synthesis response regulator PhoP
MSTSGFKLLLVEDEPHLAFTLKLNLEAEGFDVIHAADGAQAIQDFSTQGPFHGVILDVMLPEMDGFQVARAIRHTDPRIGILMLTARTGENDRLLGFEAGVDDYIAKPFHLKELLARVRRMTERADLYKAAISQDTDVLTIGPLKLDYDQLTLTNNQTTHTVTKLEADFMRELMRSPGRVVSREHLLEKVWGLRSTTETRTIDNFVVRLRKMIEVDPKNPKILISIRGKGYRLENNIK